MPDPFLAEIRMFGGNFAPKGYAFCDGQLLSIAQNTALFSLLGTTYGGNGQTTFALPDLRGRVLIHPGTGPGLSSYSLGERGGVETVAPTLTTTLASGDEPHTHELPGAAGSAGVASTTVATTPTTGSASSTAPPHENRQPYATINFIIALQGVYPSQT